MPLTAEEAKQAAQRPPEPVHPPLPAGITVSKCPLMHGSVGAGPFPGYVHGKHPAICKYGCEPDPLLGAYGRKGETPKETLIREAIEWQDLYHHERGNSNEVKLARIDEILKEIEATGTYVQTFDELEHGIRVAWRNSPKCSNRKFCMEIKLLDFRHVTTAEGMYEACLEMLEAANMSCVTVPHLACFRPETPGKDDGPRTWNNQLCRFCGYRQLDGTVLGDPAEADFTTMLQEQFGWVPPPEDERTPFDMLPLLLQPHPSVPPKLFELPPQYVARVPISHPDIPEIGEMGLQWYAVPAVSCLELSCGGLTYTSIPFNGWYSVTEIVRNLTDENRFNLVRPIAKRLGLDTKNESSMFRDDVIAKVTAAVASSFREAGQGMVDHHTLMRNFYTWYHKEKDRRGYVSGNWKWIIPPVTPTTSIKCYLELNHMTEYTLKPNYWYPRRGGWRGYLKRAHDEGVLRKPPPKVVEQLVDETRLASFKRAQDAAGKVVLTVMYASMTGNTASYAEQVAAVLATHSAKGASLTVKLLNMEEFEEDSWAEQIRLSSVVLVMTSTYGPGACPTTSNKFLAWCKDKQQAADVFDARPLALLGLGSSSYPRFCAAADAMLARLQALGADLLVPVAKADAMAQEDRTVWEWLTSVVERLTTDGLVPPLVREAIVSRIPTKKATVAKTLDQLLPYTLVHLGQQKGLAVARDKSRRVATVKACNELMNVPDDQKATNSTRQVVLDVSVSGLASSYVAGDEIAVYAENSDEVVEAIGAALGIANLDDIFLLQDPRKAGEDDDDSNCASLLSQLPLPNTYRSILKQYVALEEPVSYGALLALAQIAPDDGLLELYAGSRDIYEQWLADRENVAWADVFKTFPGLGRPAPGEPPANGGRLKFRHLVQLAPLIRPRHYSISSSFGAEPGECHITVSKLTYKLPSGAPRTGFCSSFLTSRIPGDLVSYRIVPTPGFRMAPNSGNPIVMVAAGTGIAPFRGFWWERFVRLQRMRAQWDKAGGAATGPAPQLGPCALVYGCRNKEQDLLYRRELEDLHAKGVITHLHLAISRGDGPKQYVQDVIAAKADELLPLLNHDKCRIYICGSSNMAQEVSAAFSKTMGKAAFDRLVGSGRYAEDVFGVVVSDAARKAASNAGAKAAELRRIKEMIAKFKGAAVAATAEELALWEKIDVAGARDEKQNNLLHTAAETGNAAFCKWLLQRPNLPLNDGNMKGLTPLRVAELAGHGQVAALLRAAGGERVAWLQKYFYPLHRAVAESDTGRVEAMLKDGANINQQDYYYLTPLHLAVATHDVDMVSLLLAAGADTAVQDKAGRTPLQLATNEGVGAVIAALNAVSAPLLLETTAGVVAEGAGVPWSGLSDVMFEQLVGMPLAQQACMQGSWAVLSSVCLPERKLQALTTFGLDMFHKLFDSKPALLKLFSFGYSLVPGSREFEDALQKHAIKVADAIGVVVLKMNNYDILTRHLEWLVQLHVKIGIGLDDYQPLAEALLFALEKHIGAEAWANTQVATAWQGVMRLLGEVAAKVYESPSPPMSPHGGVRSHALLSTPSGSFNLH